MPEKPGGPEFRIVGGAPEEEKEEIRKSLHRYLFDHFASLSTEEQEQLEKFEYPKSEKELAVIDFANKETNRLRGEVGLEPYDVPMENFHIVPSEPYRRVTRSSGTTATTSFTKQGIVFDAEHFRTRPLVFGVTALHETLHLKGHLSFEAEKEESGKIEGTPFRKGITVLAAQKLGLHKKIHWHFEGLHEAIVSKQTKRSFAALASLPVFEKERRELASDKAKEQKSAIAQKEEIPEDELIWVNPEGKFSTFSYLDQRRALEYVCTEIQKEFPEKFETPDAVFKEFLKAHLTGRLLPIARWVEAAFGEGSFRLLGSMTDEPGSGTQLLEALRKARMRLLRDREKKR